MGNIWAIFVGFLQSVLLTFFHWFHDAGIPGSAGLAIILFTVLARLIILPLTLKSLQSTRRMQELQPQLKEIQRKYGKDQAKLSEETMKLYKEYKVNPAGGCLPMVLQFPIFIGVYQAVLHLTQTTVAGHAVAKMAEVLSNNGLSAANTAALLSQPQLSGQFLWLTDLGKPDPIYVLGVLSVIFQLLVQLMATPRVQDAQQKAMTQSMLILPLMFGYLGFTFPAGAVLYWVVGSILSMIQQYVISGWGSLANYLKFLPTTGGLLPPITPAAATTAAGADGGSAAVDEPAAEKLSFWSVLRPLTEQGTPAETAVETEEATEQAINNVRRQMNQSNLRRRKARRS
jgi:YidC/Oxa1 family membrane protein insertase